MLERDRRYTSAWIAAALLFASPAGNAPASREAGASCANQTKLLAALTRAKEKHREGELTSARDLYDGVVSSEDFIGCTLQLQLKTRREYGDVLFQLARRRQEVEMQEEAKELLGQAAVQYESYLLLFVGDPWKLEGSQPEPRVVLNALGNALLESEEYEQLCDAFTQLVDSAPALFDRSSIERWSTAIQRGFPEQQSSARLQDFCKADREGIHLTAAARRDKFRNCSRS